MQPALEYSLYDQLMALPENLTGEILLGQLHTHPRPAGPHTWTESALESELFRPFSGGRGGPGGWIEIGAYRDDNRVSVAPFDAVTIELAGLWC